MKKLLVILAMLTIGCNGNEKIEKNNSEQIGRYVLFSGKYMRENNSSDQAFDAVFKIDTITGTTWIYENIYHRSADGVTFGTGWSEIDNYKQSFNKSK